MHAPIYLDNAATTPLDPRVFEAMQPYFIGDHGYGNYSSPHFYGKKAAEAIENARGQVAQLLEATPNEIIFTSGATESNNLAIKGIAQAYQYKGKHIITSAIEHTSILKTCAYLETQGFQVSYIKPCRNGRIDPDAVSHEIRKDTILITLAHANSEIGVIQDLEAITEIAQRHQIVIHIDASQSVGKIPINLKTLPISLLSLSAHKFYGPKGIGALFIRREPFVRLIAQQHGGDQEQGLRSGTLATSLIVGFGKACEIAMVEMAVDTEKMRQFREKIYHAIKDYHNICINGSMKYRLVNNLNFSVLGVNAVSLRNVLLEKIAFSSGSACASHKLEPSYVLKAMGRDDHTAQSAVRMTTGRFNNENEIDRVIVLLRNVHEITSATGIPSYTHL